MRLRDGGDDAPRLPPPARREPGRLPQPLQPTGGSVMDIAIPLYDRFTALDAVGPYDVLSRLPDARVTFVAAEPGPLRTENGMLALVADRALEDLPDPEVVVVPGGYGTRALLD